MTTGAAGGIGLAVCRRPMADARGTGDQELGRRIEKSIPVGGCGL